MIDCPCGLVHADEYLHTLEKCLPHFLSFSSHAQLESYLVEKRDNGKVNEITQTELEYLLVNYFAFILSRKEVINWMLIGFVKNHLVVCSILSVIFSLRLC